MNSARKKIIEIQLRRKMGLVTPVLTLYGHVHRLEPARLMDRQLASMNGKNSRILSPSFPSEVITRSFQQVSRGLNTRWTRLDAQQLHPSQCSASDFYSPCLQVLSRGPTISFCSSFLKLSPLCGTWSNLMVILACTQGRQQSIHVAVSRPCFPLDGKYLPL